VTGDDLTEYRLKTLEDVAVGARQVERDVDTLKLSTTHLEAEMAALVAELRERDDHTRKSLARIHERLDEITTAESFEKGREAGEASASTRTGRIVAVTLTLAIAFAGLIVALLTLVLH
jgi:hypothetical protein